MFKFVFWTFLNKATLKASFLLDLCRFDACSRTHYRNQDLIQRFMGICPWTLSCRLTKFLTLMFSRKKLFLLAFSSLLAQKEVPNWKKRTSKHFCLISLMFFQSKVWRDQTLTDLNLNVARGQTSVRQSIECNLIKVLIVFNVIVCIIDCKNVSVFGGHID